MTTKKGLAQRAKYIETAIEYVDQHGIDGLTMRALGEKMGVDPTAVYRHFPSKESLLDALLNQILEPIAAVELTSDSPRENILSVARAVRQAFRQHPNLAGVFASASGNFVNGLTLSRKMINILRAIGLDGEALVRMYQTFEGYILGASVFDTGGEPDTWTVRQARYQYLDDPAFVAVAKKSKTVERVTDEAFFGAVNIFVDECERLAKKNSNT